MIDLEVGADGVAVIVWNAPGRAANLLDEQSLSAFEAAVARAIDDEAVNGVVVTSAKENFSAGADLDALMRLADAGAAFAWARRVQELTRHMETGGKPFVAALRGSALGAGFEIALACHHRIAAEAPHARYGLPGVSLGLSPGAGGTQRLARMIGVRKALALLLDGARLDAPEAREAGLIDEIVPPDRLHDSTRAWIADHPGARQPWDARGFAVPGGGPWSPSAGPALIAGNALSHARTRGNYPAVQAILSCVYEGVQVDIDTGLKAEARRFAEVATGPVARNMVRGLFVNMGEANRLARRPAGVPCARFTKVGVLGAGMMGAGIAGAAAGAGIATVLLDRDTERAERGKARIGAILARWVARGRMTAAERDTLLARIAPVADYAAFAGCELVVEAVFEDRKVKAAVTRQAEAVMADDAIFASNTSTLPITGLAEASARPGGFIGLHFFSPVERMRLVEIIRGRATSDATLARAMDFTRRLGKTPIVVNDSRGFYTSRVFGAYVREGFAMLAEGVGTALIENAGRMAGMPVGPLAVADEVSLELMRAVSEQTRLDLGDAWRAPPGEEVLEMMAGRLGRFGRKAGRGFYDYPENGGKRLWPGLAEYFPKSAAQPNVEEVERRLLWVQSLEAVRCLDEGVLESAADGDIGSLLGWGFPAFTGGALSLIDTVGAVDFVAACDRLAQACGARFSPPPSLRDMAVRGGRFHPA